MIRYVLQCSLGKIKLYLLQNRECVDETQNKYVHCEKLNLESHLHMTKIHLKVYAYICETMTV